MNKEDEKEKDKKLIALQLSEPLRQRIRKEAFKKELSFSAMVREILEKYFENN